MKRKNIFVICLAVFLQTIAFAQISNTAGAEIKYLPDTSYPKNTDESILYFTNRELSYFSQTPPYITNTTLWLQSYGDIKDYEYDVKCITY